MLVIEEGEEEDKEEQELTVCEGTRCVLVRISFHPWYWTVAVVCCKSWLPPLVLDRCVLVVGGENQLSPLVLDCGKK